MLNDIINQSIRGMSPHVAKLKLTVSMLIANYTVYKHADSLNTPVDGRVQGLGKYLDIPYCRIL